MKGRIVLRSVLEGISIYSLLLWAYIVIVVIVRPRSQYFNLSIYVPVQQNILAVIAFAVSFLCFVGWQYLEKSS